MRCLTTVLLILIAGEGSILACCSQALANGDSVVSVTYWDRDRTLDGTRASSGGVRLAPRVFRIFVDEDGDLYTAEPHRDHPYPCVRGYFFRTRGKVVDCDRNLAASDAAAWSQEQEAVTNRVAKTIADEMTQTGTKMLIVLVHGFNVSDASGDYAYAERLIDLGNPGPAPCVFLEVHWDGQRFKRQQWTKTQWLAAQSTAPLVGIRLRSILNFLPHNTQINVLTHSLGGLIGATMIGDSTGMFPDRDKLVNFLWPNRADTVGPFAVPEQRMRLALLAPATGEQAFAGNSYAPGVLAKHVSLLLGINPLDDILLKVSVPFGNATSMGWTRLGTGGQGCDTKRPTTCPDVQSVMKLEALKRIETAQMVGFDAAASQECRPTDHDFYCYLTRPGFAKVLEFLWTDSVPKK